MGNMTIYSACQINTLRPIKKKKQKKTKVTTPTKSQLLAIIRVWWGVGIVCSWIYSYLYNIIKLIPVCLLSVCYVSDYISA